MHMITVSPAVVCLRVSCSDGGGSRPTASKDLGHRFILNLKPNSTLPMTLAFRPSRPMDYRLDLAFVLHYGGSVLSGDANNHNGAAVAVQVTGTGVQPALVLSKSVVDFGSEVVVRSNQPKSPYSQDIYVRNNTEGHIEVCSLVMLVAAEYETHPMSTATCISVFLLCIQATCCWLVTCYMRISGDLTSSQLPCVAVYSECINNTQ